EMELKDRKLSGFAFESLQKNEFLSNFKEALEEMSSRDLVSEDKLQSYRNLLRQNASHEKDWNKFRLHFENVHPSFFQNLVVKHPNLTKNDLRICAYLKMNLSNKEISALM